MKHDIENNLGELDVLLTQMTNADYARQLQVLSGASIGQHCRHILELYVCLLQGVEDGEVCYDNRKREGFLEKDVNRARQLIRWISARLGCIEDDKELTLVSNYSLEDKKGQLIRTSLRRELAYNLEHSIHHQALIRIGINQLGQTHEMSKNFGVAPATIRYRKKTCAQ